MLAIGKGLVVALLAAGCSGIGHIDSRSDSSGDDKGQGAGGGGGGGESGGEYRQDEGEGAKVVAPVMVTGAFLCGAADDYEVADGEEAYGCRVTSADGSKLPGVATAAGVRLKLAGERVLAPAVSFSAESSAWHFHFAVLATEVQLVTAVQGYAVIGGRLFAPPAKEVTGTIEGVSTPIAEAIEPQIQGDSAVIDQVLEAVVEWTIAVPDAAVPGPVQVSGPPSVDSADTLPDLAPLDNAPPADVVALPKLVHQAFVTSTRYVVLGGFARARDTIDLRSVAQADEACAAHGAVLNGKVAWRAVIAAPDAPLSARFPDALGIVVNANAGGAEIVLALGAILGGGAKLNFLAAVNHDEQGRLVKEGFSHWTGVDAGGALRNHCGHWNRQKSESSDAALGSVGRTLPRSETLFSSDADCGQAARLLCLSVAR